MLIICLALLTIVISRVAEYRAENDLIYRLCADQEQVMRDLRALLLQPDRDATGSTAADRRRGMIAAKLLFIVPQQGAEADGDYLVRLSEYLSGRCAES